MRPHKPSLSSRRAANVQALVVERLTTKLKAAITTELVFREQRPIYRFTHLRNLRGQRLFPLINKVSRRSLSKWYRARGHDPKGMALETMRMTIARELHKETLLIGPMENQFQGFF